MTLKYQRLFALFLLGLVALTSAQTCAPSTTSMKKWSTTYGATAGNVVIPANTEVLLDMSTVSATSITIQAGGELWFDWTKSISLTVQYIIVSGEMHLGTAACPLTNPVTITLAKNNTIAVEGIACGQKAFVVANGGLLEMHGAKGLTKSWTRLAQTAAKGATQLTFTSAISGGSTDIRGWKAGDKIVLGTTDFNPFQSEVATIASLVDTKTVKLVSGLKYMHYGEISFGADERAEVGLLSRTILIQGTTTDGLSGGHMMFLTGAKSVQIEGVEYYNMGQDFIGRYPIHFHLAGDQKNSFVRDNSIHDNNFRAIALHATDNLLVDSNVVFNTSGHAIYIEDGVERGNTFTNNLVVLTKTKPTGQRIGSDTSTGVSGFWITNPNNTYTNNVVSGSMGAGYWLHVRLGARGPSASNPLFKAFKPCTTPMKVFKGNKAVGCDHGFQIEATNFDGQNFPTNQVESPPAAYAPRFANGTAAPINVENFAAHHCSFRGLWARAVNVNILGGSFSSNFEGLQLGTSGDHPAVSLQSINDTLFVGWTNNAGTNEMNAYQMWNAAKGRSWPRNGSPRMGMVFYDGPQSVNRCSFKNFPTTPTDVAHSALGTRWNGLFQIATTNKVSDLVFDDATVTRRVVVSDRTGDGGKVFNFRDDGSVSGYEGTVLPKWNYYSTSNCKSTDKVSLVCPHRYSNMWVLDMNTHTSISNQMIITRNEHIGTTHTDYQMTFDGFFSANIWRYQPIVSIGASYLVQFKKFVSPKIAFQLNNAEIGDAVSVAVCYPPGTTISTVTRGYSNMVGGGLLPNLASGSAITSATSRKNTSAGDSYYFDKNRNILFLTVKQRQTRTTYGNFCPNSGCDYIAVSAVIPAGAVPTNCTTTAYSGDTLQVTSGSWLSATL